MLGKGIRVWRVWGPSLSLKGPDGVLRSLPREHGQKGTWGRAPREWGLVCSPVPSGRGTGWGQTWRFSGPAERPPCLSSLPHQSLHPQQPNRRDAGSRLAPGRCCASPAQPPTMVSVIKIIAADVYGGLAMCRHCAKSFSHFHGSPPQGAIVL